MSNLHPSKTLVKLADREFEILSYYLSFGRPVRLLLYIGDEAEANRIANAIRHAEVIAHMEGRMEILRNSRDAQDD